MAKRVRCATRGEEKRLRVWHERHLRRYGYVSEWLLQFWRFKRRKERDDGERG